VLGGGDAAWEREMYQKRENFFEKKGCVLQSTKRERYYFSGMGQSVGSKRK